MIGSIGAGITGNDNKIIACFHFLLHITIAFADETCHMGANHTFANLLADRNAKLIPMCPIFHHVQDQMTVGNGSASVIDMTKLKILL